MAPSMAPGETRQQWFLAQLNSCKLIVLGEPRTAVAATHDDDDSRCFSQGCNLDKNFAMFPDLPPAEKKDGNTHVLSSMQFLVTRTVIRGGPENFWTLKIIFKQT